MMHFAYAILDPSQASAWQGLRVEGARDFPLGFLVTPDEVAGADLDRCREILAFGGMRGVFAGQELVGFCGYRPQQLTRIRHRAELGPFFVTQEYQGRGAAQELMSGVIAEATSAGLAQLELFVDAENRRAVAFYERHGFKQVATIHDAVRIDGRPRDDLFMTLRLK